MASVDAASPRTPLAILVAFFLLGNIGVAIAGVREVEASPAFRVLYYVGVAWALSWWVLLDSRAKKIPTSIDHGWFVFYAWPVIVPYHIIRTRGFRGCGLILALIGTFSATWAVAIGVSLFFQ